MGGLMGDMSVVCGSPASGFPDFLMSQLFHPSLVSRGTGSFHWDCHKPKALKPSDRFCLLALGLLLSPLSLLCWFSGSRWPFCPPCPMLPTHNLSPSFDSFSVPCWRVPLLPVHQWPPPSYFACTLLCQPSILT